MTLPKGHAPTKYILPFKCQTLPNSIYREASSRCSTPEVVQNHLPNKKVAVQQLGKFHCNWLNLHFNPVSPNQCPKPANLQNYRTISYFAYILSHSIRFRTQCCDVTRRRRWARRWCCSAHHWPLAMAEAWRQWIRNCPHNLHYSDGISSIYRGRRSPSLSCSELQHQTCTV